MDAPVDTPPTTDEISMLAIGSAFLRHRRLIVVLGFAGGLIGLAMALLSPPVYSAEATFIPQGTQTSTSGLAAAASQFGIQVPASGGTWGPALYTALLRSRTLLEGLATDPLTVKEEGGRRATVMELLEITGPTPERRMELAVQQLQGMVKARATGGFEGVSMTVTTRWPSVSLEMAERLVQALNEFNLQTRKSQATAERQFAETQVAAAEKDLRAAEENQLGFLQRNKVTTSPELVLTKDRLQREVALKNQVYSTLVQSREEAKLREVRDTPVITIIEAPRLPATREPRGTIQKALIGGVLGGLVALLVAFIELRLTILRQAGGEESGEFLSLLRESTPGFVRRRLT